MDTLVCPYGVKSKWLLERKGFTVEDHHLTTREETDAFKAEHNVETTPQTFIGNVPLGFVSLSENLAMMAVGVWMMVY